MITKIGDFFWVLQAFFRGKVLKQKAYCPQHGISFRGIPIAAVKRMVMLMRWWGLWPKTLEDVKRMKPKIYFKDEGGNEHTNSLFWDGEKWAWESKPSIILDWNDESRIPITHRN